MQYGQLTTSGQSRVAAAQKCFKAMKPQNLHAALMLNDHQVQSLLHVEPQPCLEIFGVLPRGAMTPLWDALLHLPKERAPAALGVPIDDALIEKVRPAAWVPEVPGFMLDLVQGHWSNKWRHLLPESLVHLFRGQLVPPSLAEHEDRDDAGQAIAGAWLSKTPRYSMEWSSGLLASPTPPGIPKPCSSRHIHSTRNPRCHLRPGSWPELHNSLERHHVGGRRALGCPAWCLLLFPNRTAVHVTSVLPTSPVPENARSPRFLPWFCVLPVARFVVWARKALREGETLRYRKAGRKFGTDHFICKDEAFASLLCCL